MLANAAGAFLMDGGVNLRDLETQMQWDLPRDGGVETLAGFLLYRLGHIPQPGEIDRLRGPAADGRRDGRAENRQDPRRAGGKRARGGALTRELSRLQKTLRVGLCNKGTTSVVPKGPANRRGL